KFKEPSTIPRGERSFTHNIGAKELKIFDELKPKKTNAKMSNLICQSPRPVPLPLVHPQSKIFL
ncbi:hypothetical protein Gotri_019191, partial [Gossypium trilobum]|nr:hypothetical protein [Gossypium trilobum]